MFSKYFFPPETTLSVSPDELPFSLFQEEGTVLLESSLVSQKSRHTFLGLKPLRILSSTTSTLEALEAEIDATWSSHSPPSACNGMWVGYLGYEAYERSATDLTPSFWFGYYDQGYVYDHLLKRGFVFSPRLEETKSLLKEGSPRKNGTFANAPSPQPRSTMTRSEYFEALRTIKEHLANGDCYQVNFAQRFEAPFSGDPYGLYRRLCLTNPGTYAAYLNLGDAHILSSSPECFLEISGSAISTRPIKGTRPRGATPEEDRRFKEDLASHAKDRSELLMITDLERNDLGKVCVPGSIQVTKLSDIESYAHVHHQVSEIAGVLRDDTALSTILRALFPGGSITGAPKRKAMDIIRRLERHPRNVYCGAIGYVGENRQSQFNIAIRTMVLKNETAYCYSGGGIVMDSDPECEHEETLIKAKGMFEALNETVRLR